MITLHENRHGSLSSIRAACVFLIGLASAIPAFGQTPVVNAEEKPLARAQSLLRDVQDHVFSFDDEAFYWFCRHTRQMPKNSKGDTTQPANKTAPVAWRSLLERPSDYRGQRITVEGTLLTHNGFTVSGPGREDVGTLYQCELANPDTRGFCTVITTENPANIPIRSRVSASGYFLKIRAYQTNRGETGAGPLLVARCLEDCTPSVPLLGSSPSASRWIIPGTAALAMGYLVLRRRLRRARSPRSGIPRKRETPSAPAADDFAWMTELPEEDSPRSISDDT